MVELRTSTTGEENFSQPAEMLSILYDTNQNGELATYELESNFEKDSRKLGYYRWWASISYVEMPREQSKETFDRMWTALGEPES